ncbi:hypothetical protein H310_03410 [Aphanomyces invadans]|uniref:Phosphoglycerate mutase n=1 Tax=Aphanomyces invadans TaxID=157072 RepID=A0A024UGY6_9STRA|nr:hypothetical protein H310_03410 [Aphanomyces invadans]ETW05691.1 hypothetical protein H310_03410 [Aphanomyces invadans]|eukprot:XP_008865468.1 hypothetical protein H310_03410 [Aphanomyces invadans]
MIAAPPPAEKTIYFIRHGESTFNQWRVRSILTFSWIFVKDPMIIDARLSAKGRQQVAVLKQTIHDMGLHEVVDVIITSPLTRAVETTLGGFDGCNIPIQISPLCREMLDTACDIGRQPHELAQEFGSLGIDTSSLPDFWWLTSPSDATKVIPQSPAEVAQLRESTADLDARIVAFLTELHALPYSNIAVVGHSSFIKRMTKASRKLSNCEILVTPLTALLPTEQ